MVSGWNVQGFICLSGTLEGVARKLDLLSMRLTWNSLHGRWILKTHAPKGRKRKLESLKAKYRTSPTSSAEAFAGQPRLKGNESTISLLMGRERKLCHLHSAIVFPRLLWEGYASLNAMVLGPDLKAALQPCSLHFGLKWSTLQVRAPWRDKALSNCYVVTKPFLQHPDVKNHSVCASWTQLVVPRKWTRTQQKQLNFSAKCFESKDEF